jgi:hypothetical protein
MAHFLSPLLERIRRAKGKMSGTAPVSRDFQGGAAAAAAETPRRHLPGGRLCRAERQS